MTATDTATVEVRLREPKSGKEIEDFLAQTDMRNRGARVYEPEHMGRFRPDRVYGTIIVYSSLDRYAINYGRMLARKFDGVPRVLAPLL